LRRELAIENRHYIKAHNEELVRLREQLRKQELEEEDVIKKHAERQDRVNEMKKIREA
jgi:flagellar biosynthesis/type III secretory pathway chaperone